MRDLNHKKSIQIFENGISREGSLVIKGIAILMMIYHHRFSEPGVYGPYRTLLHIGGLQLEVTLAWFCKLCVALFAFVSGYGMFAVLSRERQKHLLPALRKDYAIVVKRLLRFYRQYWLVLFFWVILSLLLYHEPVVWSELFFHVLGTSSSYNGSWWYVLQYVKMMAALPLLDVLFTRFASKKEEAFKWLIPVCAVLLCAAFGGVDILRWLINWMQPSFTLSFVMGYLCARYAVYQYIERMLEPLGGWRKNMLCVFMLAASAGLRILLAHDATYARMDFAIAPVFIYSILNCLAALQHAVLQHDVLRHGARQFDVSQHDNLQSGTLIRVLSWFGRYSGYIWLIHLFFFGSAFADFVRLSGWAGGIYLTLLAMSSLAAAGLGFLERKLHLAGVL